MKSTASLALLLFTSLAALQVHAQTTITAWNFGTSTVAAPVSSPSHSTGYTTGTASSVGMNFSSGTDNSDLVTLPGSSDSDPSNIAWRVRGTSGTGGNSNGWSTGAAIATQGVQFSASTVGYNSISASFDWYPSTQGEANLLIQYTTDGTTWVNATASQITLPTVGTLSLANNTGSSNTVSGAYIHTTGGNTWYNNISLSLSGVSAANNDSSFGIRLVNASTGADTVKATGNTALDNTKGNWNFDNAKFTGSAVPEPGVALVLAEGLALLAFVHILRRKNRA